MTNWCVTKIGARTVLVSELGDCITYLDMDVGSPNANLIESAPALLEELRTLVGFIDYHELAKDNMRFELKLAGARALLAPFSVGLFELASR